MPTSTMTVEEYRQAEYKAMTEKQFQRIVSKELKAAGWLCYHTWNSMHSQAGFPDIVAARGDRLIFAELKSERGQLSEQQLVWIFALTCAGKKPYVWRPSDMPKIWEVIA